METKTKNDGDSQTAKYPYIVECTSCGNKIGRYRKSHIIKNPEKFRCEVCHGKLRRLT